MIREQGSELARAGYAVIPVTPKSKIPSIHSWQKAPLSAEDCLKRPADEGVGIVCGFGDDPVLGVDCDIEDDPELSTAIRTRFNEILQFEEACPIRHGKRPKFLIMGRMDPSERFSKFSSAKYSKDNGKTTIQVEVLGAGHYFVAYGIHPDTGKAYEWEDSMVFEKPADMPVDRLPVLSMPKLKACLRAFEEEVAKRPGYKAIGTASKAEAINDWTLAEPQRAPLEIKRRFVEVVLKDLTTHGKIDCDNYDQWLQVGMALHHQFSGSDEGLAVWAKWSSASSKYNAEVLRDKWRSFGKYPSRMRTMRSYVHVWYALGLNDKFALCESGLAHRVLQKAGDRIRYVADAGHFRECGLTTGRWVETNRVFIQKHVYDLIENDLKEEADDVEEQGFDKRAEALRAFRAKCRAKMCSTVSSVCKDLETSASTKINAFDTDPNIFAVGNGAIELSSGKFIPPTPGLMLYKGSYVNYEEGARNERWEQFIDEVTDGDKKTADYLQRVVGYSMAGVPNKHVMFFLIGRGCNGKSVFLNTLAKLFGSYYKSVPAAYFTEREKQVSQGNNRPTGPDSVLVSMIGSRFCVSTETPFGAVMQEDVIKKLASQDRTTARAPYGTEQLEIIPSWVLFLATNYFPEVRTNGDGIWRRIRAIEFGVNFDDGKHELDPWLEDKLAKNMPGILNWCLEGYRKYQKFGIDESPSARDFTENLRASADEMGRWLDERCVKGDAEEVLLKEAYASWKDWARHEGCVMQYPNDKLFSQALIDYKFTKHRVPKGMAFTGFRLLTDEERAQKKEEAELKESFYTL